MLFKYINNQKTQANLKIFFSKIEQIKIKKYIILQLLYLTTLNCNRTPIKSKTNYVVYPLFIFLKKLQYQVVQIPKIRTTAEININTPSMIYTSIISPKVSNPRRANPKNYKINSTIRQHWIFLKNWFKNNPQNNKTNKNGGLLRRYCLSVQSRTNLRRRAWTYKLNRRKDLLMFYNVRLQQNNTKTLNTIQYSPSVYGQIMQKKTKIYADLVNFYISNQRKKMKIRKNRNKSNFSLFFFSHTYIPSQPKSMNIYNTTAVQPQTWIFWSKGKNLNAVTTVLHIKAPTTWMFVINTLKPTNTNRTHLKPYKTFRGNTEVITINNKSKTRKQQYFAQIFDNINSELTLHNYISNNYVNTPARVTVPSNNNVKNVVTKNNNSIAFLYPLASNLWERTLIFNHTQTESNHATSWTNYTPLIQFVARKSSSSYKNLLARTFYNTIDTIQTSKYKTFFIFFLIQFLENFLQKKVWLRVDSRGETPAIWGPYVQQFYYSNIILYKKFNRLIPIRETLEILLLTAKTHDLQIFLSFLKYRLENAHFKRHKKMLSILFDILRKNQDIFSQLGLKGLFFDIRGKVGVSGNAKKRHLTFSLGKITTTSQNIRSYWQQIHVWTPTGQMGITCYLLY